MKRQLAKLDFTAFIGSYLPPTNGRLVGLGARLCRRPIEDW